MSQSDKIKELEERIRQLELRPIYIPVYVQPPIQQPLIPVQPGPYITTPLPWWLYQTTTAVIGGPTYTQAGSFNEVAQ